MTSPTHLITVVSYVKEPTLYRIAKAKELIRDAKDRKAIVEKWDTGGVFFEPKIQHDKIVFYIKAIERLENYCRNQIINLLTGN